MMQMEQARRSEEEKMMMERMQRQEETLRKRQEENNLFMQVRPYIITIDTMGQRQHRCIAAVRNGWLPSYGVLDLESFVPNNFFSIEPHSAKILTSLQATDQSRNLIIPTFSPPVSFNTCLPFS